MSAPHIALKPITRPMAHGSSPHTLPLSPSNLNPHAESFTFLFPPGVKPGKFGKMFPHLRALDAPDSVLIQVGQEMIEANGDVATSGDNPAIPAGFTYLGQFIDHDITFDTTPLPEASDPQRTQNFRTPRLDLDSLYGLGPTAQPYLYDRAAPTKFLIGQNSVSGDPRGGTVPVLPNDLARNSQGFALIGDPRNDENLIVAQLHLAMLKFHNKLIDQGRTFEEARREVTWHYQWIVLNEFLPAIVNPAAITRARQSVSRYYFPNDEPYIPIEFGVAAYRLGHSMVRFSYDHNRVFGPGGGPERFADGTLQLLFQFTGLSGSSVPVPSNWVIDWRRFFNFGAAGVTVNPSRKLDCKITFPLGNLPPGSSDPTRSNLAVRNLLRGKRLGLPSGQAVAGRIGATALTPAEVAGGPGGAALAAAGLDRKTPLWYYILREAELKGAGQRLGAVGSYICAEVFVGLLEGDPNSFLATDPSWTPTLPAATPGTFKMTDLLNFVGELNPIGA